MKKCTLVLVSWIASLSCLYSEIKLGDYVEFCKCNISSNKYYFLSMEDGFEGKFRAELGLIPLLLFRVENKKFSKLSITLNKKEVNGLIKYKFLIQDQDLGFIFERTVDYDISSRLKNYKKERWTPIKEFNTNQSQNYLQSRSVVVAVVGNEIFKIHLYESDNIEHLKILPISALYVLFDWQVMNF